MRIQVGIRIQLSISMRIQIRIRIQGAKPMRFHADPDPGQNKFNYYKKIYL